MELQMMIPEKIEENLSNMVDWDLKTCHCERRVYVSLDSIKAKNQNFDIKNSLKEDILKDQIFRYKKGEVRRRNNNKNHDYEYHYKLVYNQDRTSIIGVVRIYFGENDHFLLRYYFTMSISFKEANEKLDEIERELLKSVSGDFFGVFVDFFV